MTQISNASDEQSQGIAQVNDAITQMDQVTQQNAALVEQAAAAAESMQEQSAKLADVVSVFKLAGGLAPTPAPTVRKPAPARPALTKRAPAKVAGAVASSAPAPAPASVPTAAKRKAAATSDADGWEEF
jgi:methyl-accepting chemotaxis protein